MKELRILLSLIGSSLLGPGTAACYAQDLSGGPGVEELFQAIQDNDTNLVAGMLAQNTNLVRSDYYGRLPLHVAASHGHLEIVEQLLKSGADINAQSDTMDTGNYRLTALEAAVRYNHPDICRLLLKAGANPNIQSAFEGAALHYAFAYHRTEMVGLLLDYGADPFLPKQNAYNGSTAFEMAITVDDGKFVSQMLQSAGAATNAGTRIAGERSTPTLSAQATRFLATNGVSVLIKAAQRGELEAVQALLGAGVSAKAVARGGVTVIQEFALAARKAALGRPIDIEQGYPFIPHEPFHPDRVRQILQLLITNGADYDAFSATALGDLERTRRILATNHTVVQARDHDGATLLHWSVINDQLPLTSFWLEAGVSPALTNLAGETPLHLAAANGLAEQTKLLLAARAPVDTRDTNGWTALDVAIRSNQTATIRLLLTEDKAAPRPERGVALPIHQAAESGNLALLDELLLNTKDIEARNELGLTPLQVAIGNGHLAAAAMLVDKHANLNARDPDGNTALHRILLHGQQLVIRDRPPTNWFYPSGYNPRQERYVRYLSAGPYERAANSIVQAASFLLACGADVNATNGSGRTVMQLATDEKVMERLPMFGDDWGAFLKVLLFAGVNVNQVEDADGNTALHRLANAVDINEVDWMKSLIAFGADVNATNKLGQTPLHKAAEKIWGWDMAEDGDNEPFQLLVKSGANVNAKDNRGWTPLDVLAVADTTFKREATELLIKAGAKSNDQDKKGMTPLHLLIASHEPFTGRSVQALLDAHADPNARDDRGRTAAHIALTGKWPWSGASENLSALAKADADFSAKDNEGKTPLHYLAALGNQSPLMFIIGIDQMLVDAKVDFQARDNEGNMPLHIAARTGTRDVLDWLLKQSADLDATNNAGETPRLLAARQSNVGPPRGPVSPETDLSEAARQGNIEAAERLLKADPALVNQTNFFRQTPLRTAALAHQTNMVALLEKHGARWDALSAVIAHRADALAGLLRDQPSILEVPANRELLHIAAANGDIPTMNTLVLAHADIQAVDSWGLSPLGHALFRKRGAAAEWLLQYGAKENFFDATACDDLKTASALLARDKSLATATNANGLTAVHLTARLGNTNVLRLLLERGAPVNGAASPPRPPDAPALANQPVHVIALADQPLDVAALANQVAAADLLLQYGAAVDAFDGAGLTPLHWAALQGGTETVALLLRHKANLNAPVKPLNSLPGLRGPMLGLMREPTLRGDSPLHLAITAGRTNVIEVLLNHGADVNATNTTGRTPLDVAGGPGFSPEIASLMMMVARSSGLPVAGEPVQPESPQSIARGRKTAADLLRERGGTNSVVFRGIPY